MEAKLASVVGVGNVPHWTKFILISTEKNFVYDLQSCKIAQRQGADNLKGVLDKTPVIAFALFEVIYIFFLKV